MTVIQGMRKTYEQWLMLANDGLHLMRRCGADTMIDFSVRDLEGFCIMVDAMKGLGSTITPEVEQIWRQMKGIPQVGNVSQATRPVSMPR